MKKRAFFTLKRDIRSTHIPVRGRCTAGTTALNYWYTGLVLAVQSRCTETGVALSRLFQIITFNVMRHRHSVISI